MRRGSVFGGILLIAGSCIGVGMLGLPIVTGLSGLIPTLFMTFVAFAFMTTTALYLNEVGSWFPEESNLANQIQKTLGNFWKSLSWMLYLFLFYSLLVAYISFSGIHLSSIIGNLFQTNIPTWTGSVGFVVLFGWIVYLGTHFVDHVNRYMMAGKVLAFIFFIFLGMSQVNPLNFANENTGYAFFSLPILVVSFGFHNMIPALNTYLDGNKKKVKRAILGGASLTFLVYLVWQFIIIGIIPFDGANGLKASYLGGVDATQAIKSFVKSPWISGAGQALAMFAILTSFLAQTLSLTHFLSDGFKKGKMNKIAMCLLALLPPLACAISYPKIFYDAINFAGGVCAVVLFGLIPALMFYSGRKKSKIIPIKEKIRFFAIIVFALFILFSQVASLLGLQIFPHP